MRVETRRCSGAGSPKQLPNLPVASRDPAHRHHLTCHTLPLLPSLNCPSERKQATCADTDMHCAQELHVDISVSSGGLDQFLDVLPLIVEEGGMAVLQLNTSGVMAFLEAHADLETAPAILVQLLASPQHGELKMLDEGNVTTFTQQQLDMGAVRHHTLIR